MILIHLARDSKALGILLSEAGPNDAERPWLWELLRPDTCPCCGGAGALLHGQGWRKRQVVEAWWDFSTWKSLWYWRVECQRCMVVLPIVADVSLPRLFYSTAAVLAVVFGRLNGDAWTCFVPSKATQDRWLARFSFWLLIAAAAADEAMSSPLETWAGTVERLHALVWCCAKAGVRIVAPTHDQLTSKTLLEGAVRPAMTAHQSGKLRPPDF